MIKVYLLRCDSDNLTVVVSSTAADSSAAIIYFNYCCSAPAAPSVNYTTKKIIMPMISTSAFKNTYLVVKIV